MESLQLCNLIWSKICLQGSLYPDPHEFTSRTWDTKLCHFGCGKPLTVADCTRQNSFSDLQNIFLDLATIFRFVNLFKIYKILFVDSTVLLRFVIVFQTWWTLQRWFLKNITIWNIFLDFKDVFSNFVNILGLSLIGFRNHLPSTSRTLKELKQVKITKLKFVLFETSLIFNKNLSCYHPDYE